MPKKSPPKPRDPGVLGSKVEQARDRELRKQGYWFDPEAADRVTWFFEHQLAHSKGQWAGKAFELAWWQRRHLRRQFGWMRPDGTRRYRKAYWKLPRKNGKTTLAAGIGLYLMCADGEEGADVYCAANDRDQAKIAFREASAMAKASPMLREMVLVYKSGIVIPGSLDSLTPLSSESGNKDGLNPHGLIIDELHEWEDRDLWEKLVTAMGARRQPMTTICTTAGWDPNSLWAEIDDYAHGVADGSIVDDEFLPVIYEATPEDDWHSEAVWRRANPNYGVSLQPSFMESQHREAVQKPAFENAFKRYHLNIRTEQANRWMPMDRWDACGAEKFDLADFEGDKCWVAMDLSRRNDITAVVKLFEDNDLLVVFPRFYIPAADIEDREKRDKVPYRQWIRQGFITATPGNVIDYSFIRADLLVDAKRYQVLEVAYDPYGATQLALQLQDDGLTVFEFQQSIKHMSEPTKGLLLDVLSDKFRHSGNPVLRWMAANACAVADANDNIKLVKNKSAGRIDGIVATIMARARATLGKDPTSVYETRGIVTL